MSHRDYTTLEMVKSVLDITNTQDDAVLNFLIAAASSYINRITGRELYYGIWIEKHASPSLYRIPLTRKPVDTITEVYDLIDEVIVPTTDYTLQDDGSLYGDQMFQFSGYRRGGVNQLADLPTARERYRVTYTAGYATPNFKAATGSITVVAKASLVDGETFTLDDGQNPPLTFEFDVTGDGVAAGNVPVDVSADVSVANVRSTVISAINDGFQLDIEASAGGAGIVELQNEFTGTHGNTTQSETVANAGFIVTNMTLGTGGPYPMPAEIEQACIQLTVNFFRNKKRNPQIKRQHVLEAAVWYNDSGFQSLILELLRPYTRIAGA